MRIAASAALALLAGAAVLSAAPAQSAATHPPKPMFVTLPIHANPYLNGRKPAGQLAQWNGSFTDHLSQTVNYTMAGGDPATSASTKVRVYIVPVKMVFGAKNGNMTFDPLAVTLPNGQSLMDNILASPLFSKSVKFVQGGVDVGRTQYIDAYQRANFWGKVHNNKLYHVQFGDVRILPEMTVKVNQHQGKVITNPFGTVPVGEMYVNDFDTKVLNKIARSPHINPTVLPLFISYNTYLTEVPLEVCCIGGYHSATDVHPGGQTYAYTTYVDEPGSFSQDVSAMSHELGEWMDDPFTDNSVNCADNTLLENGDPLENNANYGAFPYTVGGFTYNLQSLVFLDYFGAPPADSLNSWYSFQNDEAGTCPGQPAAKRASFVLR